MWQNYVEKDIPGLIELLEDKSLVRVAPVDLYPIHELFEATNAYQVMLPVLVVDADGTAQSELVALLLKAEQNDWLASVLVTDPLHDIKD